MKRTLPLLLCLIAFVACDPARPAATPTLARTPTLTPITRFEVKGTVYDTLEGPKAPVANSRIDFEVKGSGSNLSKGTLFSDASGRFTVAVSLQSQDVLHTRAAAPGYLSSELYLTAEEIRNGAVADIGLNAPTEVAVSLEGFQWTPALGDAGGRILEAAPPDKGGLARFYLLNTSSLPVSFELLSMDGIAIDQQIAAGRVQWSRLWPDPLPPGEMGLWEIKLAETPPKIEFGVYPRLTRAVHALVEPSPSRLSIRYLTLTQERDRLLAFVRNEDPQALIHLQGLTLNGVQVQTDIKQSDLGPGEVGLVILTPDILPALGDLACVQVQAQVYGGEKVTAWGAVRLQEPYFPIGAWPDAKELNKANQEALRTHGVNTLLLELAADDDPLWTQLQDKGEFRIVAVPRSPSDAGRLAAFAERKALLAWLIADQPEYKPTENRFAAWKEPQNQTQATDLAALERAYRADKRPTYLLTTSYQLLSSYAPLAGIAGVEHYAIDAPGANGVGSHPLEEVLTYTLGLREANAPAPVWPWAQALCSTPWTDKGDGCWNRLPTPAEIRAQLYLQLTAGAKGIFWGAYRADWAAKGAAQWAELGRQSRLLRVLQPQLLYGEPAAVALDRARIATSAIVSERAVVVPLVNLNYSGEQQSWSKGQAPPKPSAPYAFQPQEKVAVTLLVPEWILPRQVFAVTPDGTQDVSWSAEARLLTFTLDKLEDVALVVISGDTELRPQINRQLQ